MSPKCVLVVDDRYDDREIYSAMLLHSGYQVSGAENGEQAISRLRTCRPDLVLLDLCLPDVSGYGVLRFLRDEAGLTVPAVAITAAVTDEERVHALREGFDEFVGKPCEPRAMLDVVRRWIGEP